MKTFGYILLAYGLLIVLLGHVGHVSAVLHAHIVSHLTGNALPGLWQALAMLR